jgi:hypothetical protein
MAWFSDAMWNTKTYLEKKNLSVTSVWGQRFVLGNCNFPGPKPMQPSDGTLAGFQIWVIHISEGLMFPREGSWRW